MYRNQKHKLETLVSVYVATDDYLNVGLKLVAAQIKLFTSELVVTLQILYLLHQWGCLAQTNNKI
jgi:hypothetical protein